MVNTTEKVLIIGAGGQIGIELTENLSKIYGHDKHGWAPRRFE